MNLAESTLLLTVEDVCGLPNRPAVVLTTNSVKEIVEQIFDFPIVSSISEIPEDASIVIVVGGGSLIDETKILGSEKDFHIVAIPSLWGSGAEISPVAVFTDAGEKKFLVGDIFRPKYRCIIPTLANSIPTKLVEYGCGDSWSHVIEGGLSPLADVVIIKEDSEELPEPITEEVAEGEILEEVTEEAEVEEVVVEEATEAPSEEVAEESTEEEATE